MVKTKQVLTLCMCGKTFTCVYTHLVQVLILIPSLSLPPTASPPRYYRALFMYDPYYHSPNEEDADEELPFSEGDIILVSNSKSEPR